MSVGYVGTRGRDREGGKPVPRGRGKFDWFHFQAKYKFDVGDWQAGTRSFVERQGSYIAPLFVLIIETTKLHNLSDLEVKS